MRSVEWTDGKFRFLDQTKLPLEETYIETTDYKVVGEAIRKLQIRGAPAIGVAAAYALVLAVHGDGIANLQEMNTHFYSAVNYLSQTRPTAVNLFVALDVMRRAYEQSGFHDIRLIKSRLLSEAQQLQNHDIDACKKIGEYGATLISPGSSVLTHCNTGALATAGSGTAQSVITTAAKQGKIVRVFVDETRPLFQGARLTAWELIKEGIEAILITDSTAGFLMQQREVDAIIVGADRIAANGDVANKIGTYTLAVLAERHNIPFYVAAPTTTIDVGTKSARNIPIEERDPEEITHVNGRRIAAQGVRALAPAFDITPNQLVAAIVSETGILRPPYTESIGALKQQSTLMSERPS